MVSKAVILAGGLGTRLSEETGLKPKPMVEIGGMPCLWHIMKTYSAHGITEFIVCCGYKGYIIKEYFANYFLHMSDVTFDMKANEMQVHHKYVEPWKVTLVDTGSDTGTGGRVKRISDYIESDSAFCLTYGDGLSNVDISASIKFHQSHPCLATVTAVQPSGRFGALDCDQDLVRGFIEKPRGDGGFINGGFFVLDSEVLNLIQGDAASFEGDVLTQLAASKQLMAFRHYDFWQPMDTLRDRDLLQSLWETGQAPWKIW